MNSKKQILQRLSESDKPLTAEELGVEHIKGRLKRMILDNEIEIVSDTELKQYKLKTDDSGPP